MYEQQKTAQQEWLESNFAGYPNLLEQALKLEAERVRIASVREAARAKPDLVDEYGNLKKVVL